MTYLPMNQEKAAGLVGRMFPVRGKRSKDKMQRIVQKFPQR